MGPSATIQHLRSIAALGLPAQAAVAAMVDGLDGLIPTRTKVFFWVGEDSSPVDFYEREPLMDVMAGYFSQSQRLAADPEEPTFDKLANSPVDYGGWRRLERMAGWERSAMKNEVFRAYGIGNNLDFTIRDGSRPVGVLALAREPGSAAYTRSEVETVLALRGHFLHAMTAPQALDRAERSSESDLAVVLVGAEGEIAGASPAAERMLYQLHPARPLSRLAGRAAPAPVVEAVRRLEAARSGRASPPPSLDAETRWGRIRIHAHSRCASGVTVVSLQHLLPLRLKRLQRAAALDLSPRERAVAVAMCAPGDGEVIARRVGLTSASYREYARRIYRRLGVDGRIAVKDLLDS